ncbi:polysaccharide biosynthesis protein [Ancylomarina salipaludis]|uniref:Polysaccharide biosynthesis protein n=1 Tax=Ancylomarina salipaludis TaxID=2501299 RepID=A0A4Q1JRE3_9BACT|nr:oligosaccharide flippase family protein [Ancylomarina salipaludis]RXQ97451.1 polysaccharide biosynthesis protein [Ancylomarina salipaludis]
MSQLKKGALLSYLSIILTNIVGLVLTPFIIHKLGDAEYGLYTLIGAFVGYISVLDFGLNNAIIRFVAKYQAEGDKKGEQNFLAISMWIYGAISLLVVLLGVALYFSLDVMFGDSLTDSEIGKAKIMFILLVFNMAITLPGGAFSAICSAYEHFVFPRMVNILRYLVRSLLVVGLLLLGGDAIGLVVLDTLMNLMVILFNSYYVLKKLRVTFKLHKFEMGFVKQIFSYSIWIFVFAIVQQFQLRGGQVIIGIKLDSVSVAIYAVGILLGNYYSSFSGAISSVFLPRATQMMVANASGAELTSMMVRIGRLSLIVLLAILGAFILFGQQFILLWVGSTYHIAWKIGLVIMLAYTIPLAQNFANSLLEANNKFYFKALVYLLFITLGTILGWFLIDSLGILGVTYGIVLGWLIALVVVNVYYSRKLKLNILTFFKGLLKRILPTFLIILIIGSFIRELPGTGWLNFGIKNILFLAIYALFMYLFAINSSEKTIIIDLLKDLVLKFKWQVKS